MKIIVGVTVVVAVLLTAALGALAIWGSGARAAAAVGPVVRVAPVERGELVEVVTAPGQLEPRRNVAISARVSARIVELPHGPGDRVTRGDPDADPPIPSSVLVRLDASDLEAALRSALARRGAQEARIEVEKARIDSEVASLAGAAASLAEAARDLQRHRDLVASGDVSQATFEQVGEHHDGLLSRHAAAMAGLEASRRALTVARYNLEVADAEIERARDDLSYTTITSPIDGVVTIVNVEPGELTVTGTMNNPGTVLMEVANLSTMLVVAELDEADVGRVQVGQPASVRMIAYAEQVFKGVVEAVALTASRSGRKHFRTDVLLDTQGLQIRSGLTADVEIEVDRHEDALRLPSQAVLGRPVEDLPVAIREDNEYVDADKTIATVVYRLVDGRAAVTPVAIGASDMTHTMILGGVSEGDTVIIGPYKVLEGLGHDRPVQDEREAAASEAADETVPAVEEGA